MERIRDKSERLRKRKKGHQRRREAKLLRHREKRAARDK